MKFQFDHTTVSPDEITPYIPQLDKYRAHLAQVIEAETYDFPEASINLASDSHLLNEVTELINEVKTPELRYVVVVGIGGSNLGTKAVYDALRGHYDTFGNDHLPKMIFLDTQDEVILHHVTILLSKCSSEKEFCINAISKSGGTTETMTNLEILLSSLKDHFPALLSRVVFTTDESSPMERRAKELGVRSISIPKLVGGRFSVLSAVGLFPLGLSGFSIEQFRIGAGKMRDICGKNTFGAGNPAMQSAITLFLLNQRGFVINDNFLFVPSLESLGKWYRQLMGESVGKDGKGITPMVSMGSVDLHSTVQLYLAGPKDKITTFVTCGERTKMNVPEELSAGLVPVIAGKSVHSIMNAIVNGTKIAYQNQNLPYIEVHFEELSEESLGAFMQMKMMEMMYLGNLLGVNTFDQPGVELYKVETKRILESV